MECIECKKINGDDDRYCSACGAELGRTLDETVRKRGFRDRQATETEITEAVAARLMRWSTWLGSIGAVIVAAFSVLLGLSYHDVRTAVGSGKAQIQNTVNQGMTDIAQVRQNIAPLKEEVKQIQSDITRYKQTSRRIEDIQTRLTQVETQVLDLSNRDLKVHTITSGKLGEAGVMSLGRGQCPVTPGLVPGQKVGDMLGLCAQGSPPTFYQTSGIGPPRPVASFSPVGFQDSSVGAKPGCDVSKRGTLFVEKGGTNSADKPFLCVKDANGAYRWNLLAVTQ